MVVRKSILIIFNPKSGLGGAPRAIKKITTHIKESDFEFSTHNVQEKEYSRDVLSSSDILILIGGDGTLRRCIRALHKFNLDKPILLIPRGSANVVAKSLGIPLSLKKSLRALDNMNEMSFDIARVNKEDFFIVAFAMGYLSDRVTKTSRNLKKKVGFLGYIISFMRETSLPLHMFTYTINGTTYKKSGHSLFVVNAANVFGVGSARNINYQDGVFELVVTTNTSFWSLPGLVIDFYFRKKNPRHFVLERGSNFIIHADKHTCQQLDGDSMRETKRIHIEVLPKAQSFIM